MELGDIICKSGHVEFYVGYNYDVTYNGKLNSVGRIVRDKKYGIESIKIGNKANQGHSTFGWGNVHNTFPTTNDSFRFNNNVFRWYHGNSADNRYFKSIWRKN